MKITNIRIEKFRSIEALTFPVTPLTAICGPNSCGKSNILRALRFAFLPTYDPNRMANNICHQVVGGNVACQVKITFSKPSPALVASLGLMAEQPFTYSISVKRNGAKRAYLNGSDLSDEKRASLLDGILVVHVPPIRDIASGGLKPFKDTLADILKKTRGDASFTQLNDTVRTTIQTRGRILLQRTRNVARDMLGVDELLVDTDGIELEQLLPSAGLLVKIGDRQLGLDKLGTGHQSTVILKLYRELGEETEKFVLFLFEEPDNHLHPTSLRAIAEELAEATKIANSQVLLTTHSPYLLNQFDHREIVPVKCDEKRLTVKRPKNVTRTDREVRVTLGKYGLKPSEALLAKRVAVVEGPNDVTLLRTLVELETGISPDRQDVLIIPAGGKGPVADLAGFLQELGADWRAFFDWDATESTHLPLFVDGLTPGDITALTAAANTLLGKIRVLPTRDSKAAKLLASMLKELGAFSTSAPSAALPPVAATPTPTAVTLVAPASPVTTAPPVLPFKGSILGMFLRNKNLLVQAEIVALQGAITRHQHQVACNILNPKGIWLWSGCIEEVILRTPAAETDAETFLRGRGSLKQVFANPADRRTTLIHVLHDSAHEPELVRDVVEHLWKQRHFDHSQIIRATHFLTR